MGCHLRNLNIFHAYLYTDIYINRFAFFGILYYNLPLENISRIEVAMSIILTANSRQVLPFFDQFSFWAFSAEMCLFYMNPWTSWYPWIYEQFRIFSTVPLQFSILKYMENWGRNDENTAKSQPHKTQGIILQPGFKIIASLS